MEIIIPGAPPSINATYKVVTINGRGRLAKHEKVVVWQDEVAWRTRAAMPKGWVPARRVRITIEWWMNRAGRDSDGPLKALLDGIAHGLGIDDQVFLPTVKSNEVDRVSPRTRVWIENEDDGED